MPEILHLNRNRDAGRVLDLMQRASDYMQLEYGRAPDAASVTAFFDARVPGGDPGQAVKLGLAEAPAGRLLGLADMGFGYPQPQDAYIGLVMLDPALRGQALGPALLHHLTQIAKTRGAARQLVAVLKANPRAIE